MVNAVGNGIFAVVDRRRVVLRVDQLDLDIAPIADRKREQGVGWLAAIFHVAQPDILHDEEGTNSDRFGPVAKRCVEVGRQIRSEERRVGKEWVSTGRSRGSPDHLKKN